MSMLAHHTIIYDHTKVLLVHVQRFILVLEMYRYMN